MKSTPAVLFVSLILLCSGCQPTLVDDFLWIEGEWSRTFQETTQQEVWVRTGDTLTGQVRFITHSDTTVMEHRSIHLADGNWILIRTIPEQGMESSYTLPEIKSNQLTAQITGTGFPQQLTYVRVGDSLHVQLGGTVQGFLKSAAFSYGLTH